MSFYEYCLLLVILKCSVVFGDTDVGSSCLDPNNQPGKCISIRNCPTLFDLLNTRANKDPSITNFLKKSKCGDWVNGQLPQVCCASGVNVKCGKSKRDAIKIIGGGKNAMLGDWPWMVALGYKTVSNPAVQFQCGGSLISDRWVLTAAHCVRETGSLILTTVRVGDLNLDDKTKDGTTPEDIRIDQIIPHPHYSSHPYQNDIALLKLSDSVTFTESVGPICIPSGEEYKNDTIYFRKAPYITGWGATKWRGPRSNHLQAAQVDIVDIQLCARNYSDYSMDVVIDHRVLCASRRGTDTCQGDSGGPLILPQPKGNTYYVAGVASLGIKCANSNYPGVYTRVAQFVDWIRNTTGL